MGGDEGINVGQRVGSFLLGHESGHSIARPIACGNRVPPQRTVLGETSDPLACPTDIQRRE
ncbi:MAG: hypothetical protein EGR99_02845 [Faecalibacterium sp.]|nr:hypothetical protein [Faecalibacterium sp.]